MFEQIIPAEVIPFREFDGIFLVKKQSTKIPGAQHYGVLVAGEPLRWIPHNEPVVIHRTLDMRADWADTTGVWELVEQVPPDQTQSAVARASMVFDEPDYYLLTNNCEHTARYITSGEKRSTQVGWYLGVGAAIATVIWLINRSDN
jgi:hypothetical protein